jgi:hypothetical protein
MPVEMLQEMRLESGKIPRCGKTLLRLKAKDWHLTKLVWNFTPAEMRDLEFEPAIPVLTLVLSNGLGSVAAQLLAQFGPDGMQSLVTACRSSNSTERINGAIGFERARTTVPAGVLMPLLNDAEPQVRLHALRCVDANWNRQFADRLVALLHDSHVEIWQEASGCLYNHEPANRTTFYLSLLNDPDSNVRMQALAIATWINRYAPSEEVFGAALRSLKDPSEDVRGSALHTLQRMSREDVPKADLLPLLYSSRGDTIMSTVSLLRKLGISSTEAAPLMTNKLGSVRLTGLRVMQENGDATAVVLSLPLLRDPNSLIRSRAFATLQTIAGQNISDSDPARWEAWWVGNKATFKLRKSEP